jgi:lauroyl/myristoyl acyltransferase
MSLKYVWWVFVNVVFVPIYLVLFLIALICSILPINPTRLCRTNLSKRYGSTFLKTWLLTIGVYLNYGLYFVEAFLFWRLNAIIVLNETEYFEFLKQAAKEFKMKERQKGFLFLGAHYCVIEQIGDMMNKFLRAHNMGEVNVLYKPAKLPVLSWFLEAYRRSRRFSAIATGDSVKVRAAIEKCLLTGDSLALVADQKPKKGGIFLKFFGEFAGFPFLGIQQALDHPVVCVANTARRTLPGMFRLEYALLPNIHLSEFCKSDGAQSCLPSLQSMPAEVFLNTDLSSQPKDHVVAVLSQYAGWLEAVIRLSPAQWCWDYRKWSRSPK